MIQQPHSWAYIQKEIHAPHVQHSIIYNSQNIKNNLNVYPQINE